MNSPGVMLAVLLLSGAGYFLFVYCPYAQPGACTPGVVFADHGGIVRACQRATDDSFDYCSCVVDGLEKEWSYQKYEHVQSSYDGQLFRKMAAEAEADKHSPDLTVYKHAVENCS